MAGEKVWSTAMSARMLPGESHVEACGLTMADLYLDQPPARVASKRKPKSKGTIVATYDYRDELGQMLYQVVSHRPEGLSTETT